jgi:2-desacetyl-2-hydroxyethyl bacteriochlorophyllide A dehydrogenase
MSTARRLVFREPQAVEVERFELAAPGPGQVTITTTASLMSTGTEGIVWRHDFDEGSTFALWVRYPFHPGYATVGVVSDLGDGVDALDVGDRVFHRAGHCSAATLDASRCVAIPDSVPDDAALWSALGKIAFRGAYAARYRLGDVVVVVGAGPVGQMSIRWAAAAGCERIVAIDPAADRLEHASRGGATDTLALSVADAPAALLERLGRLADVVVDATGHHEVLPDALRLATNHGRVVLIGTSGHPTRIHLTEDMHFKGLSVVAAHDMHDEDGFTEPRVIRLLYRLAETNRFPLDALVTHRFAPEQAADAYALADERRGDTMGIAFDFRGGAR